MYYLKYIKYKNKYVNLRNLYNQSGGNDEEIERLSKEINTLTETIQEETELANKVISINKLCELYVLNDDQNKAKESLELAKVHYNKLPLRIKNTSFMKALKENINAKNLELKSEEKN